jgi:hypothetical protein
VHHAPTPDIAQGRDTFFRYADPHQLFERVGLRGYLYDLIGAPARADVKLSGLAATD